MSWESIGAAVLAGGMAGQLVTLFWGNRLTEKREFNKWLEQERYKLFCSLVSKASHTPKDQTSLDNWTYEIRDISQQIHILFKDGTAPKDLENTMEIVFILAKEKKKASTTPDFNQTTWKANMRQAVSDMRKDMSASIKVH